MEDTSLSKANKLSKTGRLFENNAPKGSVISWRHRAGVGGTPTGRIAMSEVTPFTKHTPEGLIYCQCKYAAMDSQTHSCTKCGNYFDVTENKKLVEYKIVGV